MTGSEEVVGVASDESCGIEHLGGLEAFAVECALDAAWATEFWIPADPDYGFVDYFEAAAARNLALLRGFEDLGELAAHRGILPGVESEQARLVTDGGDDWNPEPATLRDEEQTDEDTHAERIAEQLRMLDDWDQEGEG